jgi:hypothetical protein
MPEKTLIEIGDHVTLNEGTIIQCHSLEDGVFKSDHTVLGAGATVGVAAFVHYGVTVGDDAVIGADSFVMKGEEVDPAARWAGNPAREVPEAEDLPHLPVVRRSPLVPLALAGMVAVTLPAGLAIAVAGTDLPFVRAAVAGPAPATSAVPAGDAADDADPTGAADDADDTDDTDDTDDAADAPDPAVAVTPAARPATTRAAAAPARTTTAKATKTKATSTKATAANATSTRTSTSKATTSTTKTTSTRSSRND